MGRRLLQVGALFTLGLGSCLELDPLLSEPPVGTACYSVHEEKYGLSGECFELVADADRVYAICTDGVSFINNIVPASPFLEYHIPSVETEDTNGGHIARNDSCIISSLDDSDSVRIIDTTGAEPVHVGTYSYTGEIDDLAIANNLVFLVNYRSIEVLDITDKAHPQFVAKHVDLIECPDSYDCWGSGRAVTIGDFLLVAYGSEESPVAIVDFSDPLTPVVHPYLSGSSLLGYPDAIWADEETQRVFVGSSERVMELDFTTPSSPNFVKLYDFSQLYRSVSQSYHSDIHLVAATDEWLFLTGQWSGGPVLGIRRSTGALTELAVAVQLTSGYIHGMTTKGDLLLLAAGPSRLVSIDVSDMDEPSYPAENHSDPGEQPCRALAVTDDVVYRVSEEGELRGFDLSGAAMVPGHAFASVSGETVDDIIGVFTDGARVVPFAEHGFWILEPGLELADPLVQKAYQVTEVPTTLLQISDEHVFRFGGSVMEIYSIQIPSTPILEADLEFGAPILDAALGDGYAAVATDEGITIVDISLPTNPETRGTAKAKKSPQLTGIATSEKLVFATYGETGLKVFDVADPLDPFLLADFDYWDALDVIISGTNAYILWADTITIVDISIPTAPFPRQWVTSWEGIWSVANDFVVDQGRGYYCSEDGIQVLNLEDCD